MVKPEKVLRLSVIGIISTVIFSGFLYHFFKIDPLKLFGHTELCIFHAISGKKCPGCGMTRAFLAIGKLQFLEAFKYNIFALPFFAVMVLYAVRPGPIKFFQSKIFLYSILGVALIYTVMRNI
ncbi:MAG: DUF2752 domain-containing protein [Candidatus Marinimicrobia bacterium]|nr:DUF2752 domain-containing protein [Candidatus Neomarinimicrobiota bacterium]